MQLVKPVIHNLATSFEVTSQANDIFNAEIQKKLSTSVWSSCTSWYRLGHSGKVFSQWPGTLTQYWWRLRNPIWGDYKAVGANQFFLRQRATKLVRGAGVVSLMLALVWAHRNQEVVSKLYSYVLDQVCLLY